MKYTYTVKIAVGQLLGNMELQTVLQKPISVYLLVNQNKPYRV